MKHYKNVIKLAMTISLLGITNTVMATDYLWQAAEGSLDWSWSDGSKWDPEGVPNSSDDNVTFSIAAKSSTFYLAGDYLVRNLSVTASGGTSTTFLGGNTNGSYSLGIGGVLSKNNGSSIVAFYDDNSGHLFNLSIATLNFTNTGGGAFYFGRSDGGRRLNSLSIAELNIGATHSQAPTATLAFNVSNDYSLGVVTFSGNNIKKVYLINNSTTAAGYDRVATVNGINQESGDPATIFGSNRITSNGENHATLRIDTAQDEAFAASVNLSDGQGGSLTLQKTGQGKQTLSGALNHTGGIQIEEGVLVITGSINAQNDLSVSKQGILSVGAALSAHDISLENQSTLGFDLDNNASLNISGDLKAQGEEAHSFVIDFQNTGNVGQSYQNILTVAGANAFSAAELSFINFGAEGLSGTLTMNELTGIFTLSIPEPSSGSFLLGVSAVLAFCLRRLER